MLMDRVSIVVVSVILTLNLSVQAQHCKRNVSNIAHIILSTYLSMYLIYLSIYLSIYLTLNLSVQAQHCKRNASNIAHIILSIYLSIYLCLYLFIYILSIKEGIYYTRNNNGNVKDMIYIWWDVYRRFEKHNYVLSFIHCHGICVYIVLSLLIARLMRLAITLPAEVS